MRIDEHTNGDIDVLIKQFWKNYRGDNLGITHQGYERPDDYGHRLETIRLLSMHWTARKQTVDAEYVHPRNNRYKEADYRAVMRTPGGPEELEALGHELRKNLSVNKLSGHTERSGVD